MRFGHADDAGIRRPPWSRLGEAARLFTRGIALRPAIPVVAVVGCVLPAVSDGTQIATGHTSWLTMAQVALNFVVPLLVASYGYLSAGRIAPSFGRESGRLTDLPFARTARAARQSRAGGRCEGVDDTRRWVENEPCLRLLNERRAPDGSNLGQEPAGPSEAA